MEITNYRGLSSSEVIEKLGANVHTGYNEEQVLSLREKYGKNELDEEEEETMWDKIKEQFEDRFVRLLLLAALVSFVVSILGGSDEDDLPAWVEPSVIILILIANGFIGIYQDYNAEKATLALKNLQSTYSLTLRNGKWDRLQSWELVPGDYVKVIVGDMVPADMRLVKMNSLCLTVNQAPLTGETKEISKTSDPCNEAEILHQTNMIFSGTLVVSGSAEGIVTSTGMKTQIGEIQRMVQEAKEDTSEEKTPLGQKLDGFGQFLEKAIFYICVIIWVINFSNFWDPMLGGPIKGCLYYFKIAVALAVAAIPEGLPAVITTCLALGTRRMTKNNAIIKKLPSVETLGCTTVICSDKTGTLTLNQMVAGEFVIFGNSKTDLITSTVETDSYRPWGKITSELITEQNFKSLANVQNFVNSCAVNTTCRLISKDGVYTAAGTATEGAILALANKFGQFIGNTSHDTSFMTNIQDEWVIKNINSFDSKRKCMSVLARKKGTDKNILFVKGAPEKMIDGGAMVQLADGTKKQITNSDRDIIQAKINQMCSQGLRVLGIGIKEDIGEFATFDGIDDKKHPKFEFLMNPHHYGDIEQGTTLLGFIGISDPVRHQVPRSIDLCRQAGICVFIVTGDNKGTAIAVGKQCGLINDSNAESNTLTGHEFEMLYKNNINELKNRLSTVISNGEGMIFARTSPKHKKTLIKVLKELDQVVAMTGDGVNDAAALQQADIGIAMGITGTEVAKDNSDMILIDDNFATIVKAVEEGRGIYENMKAFIRYMISSNIGEVISIFFSTLMGIPDGFNSIQLLWVNLVTDGLPAMALSFNPPDADIMVKPPRTNKDGIVDAWVLIRYMAIGIYIGVATVGIFLYWYLAYDWANDGHELVSLAQLRSWGSCPTWEGFTIANYGTFDFSKNPCSYFTVGKAKASTLSLSVLVMIEMFNAFNAISENQSLFSTGILINPYLIFGILSSVLLHCVIIYIPSMNFLFSTLPMDLNDWILVIAFSFPVIIIDEFLKIISRKKLANEIEERLGKKKVQ